MTRAAIVALVVVGLASVAIGDLGLALWGFVLVVILLSGEGRGRKAR